MRAQRVLGRGGQRPERHEHPTGTPAKASDRYCEPAEGWWCVGWLAPLIWSLTKGEGGEQELLHPSKAGRVSARQSLGVAVDDALRSGAVACAVAAVLLSATMVSCTSTESTVEPEPPELVVITDGLPDSLVLEWAGGAANATSWQYRTREWRLHGWLPWSKWLSVPGGSHGSTHSYRLTGLRTPVGYQIQVRPLTGAKAGVPSNSAEGITASVGNREIGPKQFVEGDGLTLWRHHGLVRPFIIPDGMRVQGGGAWVSQGGCPFGVGLSEVTTGSWVSFCVHGFTCELVRHIPPREGTRAVEAFFDQLAVRCPVLLYEPPSRAREIALAAAGGGAIGVYAVAIWWVVRSVESKRDVASKPV